MRFQLLLLLLFIIGGFMVHPGLGIMILVLTVVYAVYGN